MILQSILGLTLFLSVAWLLSEQRRNISLRTVSIGLGLQIGLAIVLLKVPFSKQVFLVLNRVILALEESTQAGSAFVFGYIGGGPVPFEVTEPNSTYILAFQALPLILMISALTSLLFYWRLLPLLVQSFSKLLGKTLGLGGAEGLGVSANVFLGMVESPLAIRPYLKDLSRSELFTVMTCGMATIAGTVMVLYASILSGVIDNILGHILAASIINAPGSVVISKLMIPHRGSLTTGELTSPEAIHNSIDAITKGTLRGVQLMLNVAAMLIVLVALVYLTNLVLGLIPTFGYGPLTLEGLLGALMAPVVWLMGIPWSEASTAGALMGTKTILNELVAYLNMSQLPEGALSPRSLLIMTYAMCGFANPGSLGIMIGGLGTMAPERRDDVVELGLRSIIAGTLTTLTTGAIVGIMI